MKKHQWVREDMPAYFYMVFVEGMLGPRVKHDTLEKAEKEAERLARHNIGKKVHVLAAVETAQVEIAPVSWTHAID